MFSWYDKAACAQEGAYKGKNPFFSPLGERPQARARRIEIAKKICDVCPVFDNCLEYIKNHAETGVWAGMDVDERREKALPILSDEYTAVGRRIASKTNKKIA